MTLLPFEKRSSKLIIRYSSETNKKYGKKLKDRSIKELLNTSLINLDKPSGPTSHEVADTVKGLFKASSCGHGGTLDPKVTGVLPIGLNKATRLLEVFLHGGKEYVCEMRLHKEVSKKELLTAFKSFTGVIKQLPPIKSSVKRVLRDREVYYIKLLDFKERTVLFRVGCEAGTYIRKLCTDLGEHLGVKAHMQELRRTKASSFEEKDSVTLFDLQDALTLFTEKGDDSLLKKILLPIESGVTHLKKVIISDGGVAAVAFGAPLMLPGVVKLDDDIREGDLLAVFSLKSELVALGTALMSSKSMKSGSKGVAVKTKKVFIEPDVYPRSWKE